MTNAVTVAGALAALAVTAQGAFAEVTVSTANQSAAGLEVQMAALFDTEKVALRALPAARRDSLARGRTPPANAKTADADLADAETAVAETAVAETADATRAEPPSLTIRYDDVWLAAQPAPTGGADWECLREAIYFEARGEPVRGQFAVAEVILNRVETGRYGSGVCGVVNRGGGGSCQFSYTCDGAADTLRDPQARDRAGRIARLMLDGAPRALTAGATYFHASGVSPSWSRRFDRTAAIGAHMFYRSN